MKIIYWIKIVLFLLVFIGETYAQSSPLEIRSSYYFVDKGSTHTLEDIQRRDADWFKFDENENIKYGYNTNDAIWCKINLYNPTNEDLEKWLVFDNIYLDSVTVYSKSQLWLRGDRTGDEKAVTPAPSFKLNIKANDSSQIIVRIKKTISFLEFKYRLTDEYLLLRVSNNEIIFYTFVFGLVFMFFLFNFILYLVSKRSIYLRYSWHVIAILIYLSIGCGFAKFCLFPSFLHFSELRLYTSFIALSAFINFVIHYMNFKETQKFIFKIIRVSNFLNWSILFVSLFFYLTNFSGFIKPTMLANYLNLVVSLVILIIGLIKSTKTEGKKAFYTLSIFVIALIWALLFVLKETTSLDFNLNIDWLFLSNIYEVILFGILLAIDYYKTFINNQKLMQEVIFEKEKNLKAFADGEVIERKRLANTLHDNFGSRLAAIKLFLGQKLSDKASEELEVLSGDIRNLSHQIMPRSLQEGALIAAMEKHVAIQNEANPALKIEMFKFDMPEKMYEPWIYDIYLIAQEIINNTTKHANAKSLTIEFFGYDNEFIFQFTDDGKGFDSSTTNKGVGLENMDLRIKNHGGKFEINSTINEGTIIIIALPAL